MEKTFVMLKPDCISRRLIGEVISRLEKKGLNLIGIKLLKLEKIQAERLYEIHRGKQFYAHLLDYATSGPIVATVWEGFHAVGTVRKLIGATFGYEAEPGSIRGDFALSRGHNIVHASDSPERSTYEISIFFRNNELIQNLPIDLDAIYEQEERA
ncbi:MAG: nucleoside-diphosphate kinase [Planctomycetes bacterium]|nr:nucleoside-diphosphate kinase [Planctomycetota bacterium]